MILQDRGMQAPANNDLKVVLEVSTVCFFRPHFNSNPLLLKAADEKPGPVWQRVSNCSTSDFFFSSPSNYSKNDVIFPESSAM